MLITEGAVTTLPSQPTRLSIRAEYAGQRAELAITHPATLEVLDKFSPRFSLGKLLETIIIRGSETAMLTSADADARRIQVQSSSAVREIESALTHFTERLNNTVGAEGSLATVISQALAELRQGFASLVTQQGDPRLQGTVAHDFQRQLQEFKDLVEASRAQYANEMQRTASQLIASIATVVNGVQELDPSSALGRAIEQMLTDLAAVKTAAIVDRQVAAERARGTAKGRDYEEFVSSCVSEIAQRHLDRAEPTGATTGDLISKKSYSKRGDVTCRLADSKASIVVEAMSRDAERMRQSAVEAELREAMHNRHAAAAIAVTPTRTGRLMNGQCFVRFSDNMFAVHLDPEEPSLVALEVAYTLARWCALRSQEARRVLDPDTMRKGLDELNAKLTTFEELKRHISNTVECAGKSQAVLDRIEREVRESLYELLSRLTHDRSATSELGPAAELNGSAIAP